MGQGLEAKKLGQKTIQCSLERRHFCLNIALFRSPHHTTRQVFIQNQPGDLIQGSPHCCHLNQDIGAVFLVLDHALQPAHMAFDAGEAVDNASGGFGIMGVGGLGVGGVGVGGGGAGGRSPEPCSGTMAVTGGLVSGWGELGWTGLERFLLERFMQVVDSCGLSNRGWGRVALGREEAGKSLETGPTRALRLDLKRFARKTGGDRDSFYPPNRHYPPNRRWNRPNPERRKPDLPRPRHPF